MRALLFELRRRARADATGADGDRRRRRPATRCKRERHAVGNDVELRLEDVGLRCEPLDRRMQDRRFRNRQLARAHHAEHDAIE